MHRLLFDKQQVRLMRVSRTTSEFIAFRNAKEDRWRRRIRNSRLESALKSQKSKIFTLHLVMLKQCPRLNTEARGESAESTGHQAALNRIERFFLDRQASARLLDQVEGSPNLGSLIGREIRRQILQRHPKSKRGSLAHRFNDHTLLLMARQEKCPWGRTRAFPAGSDSQGTLAGLEGSDVRGGPTPREYHPVLETDLDARPSEPAGW
jgi:hypothetical protein